MFHSKSETVQQKRQLHHEAQRAMRSAKESKEFNHGYRRARHRFKRPVMTFATTLRLRGIPDFRNPLINWCIRQDSNLQPSDPKSEALSN
jgi:hypothetical protein